LIYRIGQLGDTIAALPALWALRKQFPDSHLTLLSDVHPESNLVAANQVLPSEGLIDAVLTYRINGSSNVASLFSLLLKLRRLQFDALAYLAPRLRTNFKIQRDLAFFRLAGIRHFIGQEGFAALTRRKFSNETLPVQEHEADHLLRRLAQSGISIPRIGRGDMSLALTAVEQKEADDWLRVNVSGYPVGVNLIGFGVGSKCSSKLWPEERFAELGRALIDDFKLYPLVFGGHEDGALGDRLISVWGRGSNAAGVLSIRLAAAALARCRMYVGNDTGTMHLAAAVGTPCVAIFSARDWPGRWFPYGENHTVLRKAVPCEGCMLQVCSQEGLRCLKEISVDEVIEACHKALINNGNSSLASAF
jgi:ADP-heptose:LPS heptosyltransferase